MSSNPGAAQLELLHFSTIHYFGKWSWVGISVEVRLNLNFNHIIFQTSVSYDPDSLCIHLCVRTPYQRNQAYQCSMNPLFWGPYWRSWLSWCLLMARRSCHSRRVGSNPDGAQLLLVEVVSSNPVRIKNIFQHYLSHCAQTNLKPTHRIVWYLIMV